MSNQGADSVGVFDVTTRKMIMSVQTGSAPNAMALTPNETMLLAAGSRSGDIAVIRLDKRIDKKQKDRPPYRMFTTIPAGMSPSAIAVKAFDATIR